jgi:Icc-related predicted phosphoesterase
MRIHVLSDLHLDAGPWTPPQVEADVIVIAGDLYDDARRSAEWCVELRQRTGTPVIFVPGNHEFFGSCYQDADQLMREISEAGGVHYLHNEDVVLGGVRFVGATLWTDFCVDGLPLSGIANHAARDFLPDYKHIRYRDGDAERALTPEDTVLEHGAALVAIQEALADAYSEPVVVITHHAPLAQSLDPAYKGSALNPTMASNLDELVGYSMARAWIHGHIHRQRDYQLGSTRVVCNPRGHKSSVNAGFKPDLVLNIAQ